MAERRPRPRNLIEQLLAQPLEPAYADEARRRRAAGGSGSSARSPLVARLVMLLTMALIGLVVVVGYQTLRPPEAVSSPRTELARQLVERQDLLEEQSIALSREQRAIADRQQQLLQSGGRDDLAKGYEASALAAAATELPGPGLRITLDDTQAEDEGQRVIAADLQRLTNVLWAAGADGVAINGHRLSATAGIRFAGKALVVDFRALQPPYVVEAVGPADLPSRFDELGGATQLGVLREEYDISTSVQRQDALRLPADPTLTLHHARPITVEAP